MKVSPKLRALRGLFRLRKKDATTGKRIPLLRWLLQLLEDCLPIWLVGMSAVRAVALEVAILV